MCGGDWHSTALECSATKSVWKEEDLTDIVIGKCNVNSTVVKCRLIFFFSRNFGAGGGTSLEYIGSFFTKILAEI